MLRLQQINMKIGQKRVRFKFTTAFTRISAGLKDGETSKGFTRYFKEFKKQVEDAGEADKFIFIFTAKEYAERREELYAAEGKVIIIDNTAVTLAADDELFHSGNSEDLFRYNQLIVKDFAGEPCPEAFVEMSAADVGYITEIKKRDSDKKIYTEVRLLYRNRIDYGNPVAQLFIDRDTLDYAGLDLVNRDDAEEDTDVLEANEALISSLAEYEVLDVTNWKADSILSLLKTGKVKIFSDKELPDEVIGEVKLFISETPNLKDIKRLSQYEQADTARFLVRLKQKVKCARMLGPVYMKGHLLLGTQVFLWSKGKPEEAYETANGICVWQEYLQRQTTWEHATLVKFPEMYHINYGIEMLSEPEEHPVRFTALLEGVEGFTKRDGAFLIGNVLSVIGEEFRYAEATVKGD